MNMYMYTYILGISRSPKTKTKKKAGTFSPISVFELSRFITQTYFVGVGPGGGGGYRHTRLPLHTDVFYA